jgi:predicted nucleic acid-binding protein
VIVLDTTILVYAIGEPHPLRDPCRRVLRAQADGRIAAATTVEVVQEFTHVRAQRRSRADAAALARHYLEALTIIQTSLEDFELGLDLFTRHRALGAFDAVLAAVAVGRRADGLISADRAFRSVPDLDWVDPASSRLSAVLGD